MQKECVKIVITHEGEKSQLTNAPMLIEQTTLTGYAKIVISVLITDIEELRSEHS